MRTNKILRRAAAISSAAEKLRELSSKDLQKRFRQMKSVAKQGRHRNQKFLFEALAALVEAADRTLGLRPFPVQALREAVSKVNAVGVVDRSVSFGWNCGPVYQELLSTLYLVDKRMPAVSFIGGLAGADITVEHFGGAIETTARALRGEDFSEPIWLNEKD